MITEASGRRPSAERQDGWTWLRAEREEPVHLRRPSGLSHAFGSKAACRWGAAGRIVRIIG